MLPSAASCRKRSRRARGVLRPRALVAVRQQQRQARRLAPLGQAGDDELVDDDLRAVDEVAELRLPEHERLGRLVAVAVLEAERGRLGERGVVQLHRRERARAGSGSGSARWPVLASCSTRWRWLNVPRSDVLAGEADGNALGQQRRVGERLGVRPVDPAVVERLAAAARAA